jgi:NAD(P)-dependent dehydrogenase (short-subunit alcohol dehydrogenase family)
MTSSATLTVPSLFDFRNHVVLVTGGATGLGEMAAQAFVQNGARVFIASRKESELKKACPWPCARWVDGEADSARRRRGSTRWGRARASTLSRT